jgi:Domain of unknown function (DUF4288)
MKGPWFAAKCVFRHRGFDPARQVYEERIILIRAKSLDAALKKAEKEAGEYSQQLEKCEYLGYVDVFELFDENIGNKTEIYSSMQTSDLEPEEYLDHFYPEVSENCEAHGQIHRWYKKDELVMGCYHCKTVRKAGMHS